MPVTRHPPHRSRRAALPHRAPASGRHASALRGIRRPDRGRWTPLGSASIPPLPGQALALTAPSYDATPGAAATCPEAPQPAHGARAPSGPRGPSDTPGEPGPALRAGPVPTLAPRLLDLLEWRAAPCGAGPAPPRALAARGWAAPGRHAAAVAGLWGPWATPLASCAGPTPTRPAARLLRGPCPAAPLAALPQGAPARRGGVCGLAADPAIVTGPHAADLAPCLPAAPRGGPAGTDRGPGAGGHERPGPAPGRRPCCRRAPGPLRPPARLEPLTAGADDTRVPPAGRDTRHPPCVLPRLRDATQGGRASPGEVALVPAARAGLPRRGRAAARAGPGRDAETRGRGPGVAPRARRPLDACGCPRRRAPRAVAPRGGRDGDARDRGGRVGAPLQAL